MYSKLGRIKFAYYRSKIRIDLESGNQEVVTILGYELISIFKSSRFRPVGFIKDFCPSVSATVGSTNSVAASLCSLIGLVLFPVKSLMNRLPPGPNLLPEDRSCLPPDEAGEEESLLEPLSLPPLPPPPLLSSTPSPYSTPPSHSVTVMEVLETVGLGGEGDFS